MHPYRRFLAAGATSAGLSLVLLASCSSEEGTAPIAPTPDAAAQTDAAPRIDASSELPDGSFDAGQDGAVAGGCASYASAYCARLQACAPGFFVPTEYLDAAACESIVTSKCALDRAAPGVSVTSTGLASCGTDLADFSCSKVLARQLPASCGNTGTQAVGAACGNDLQCATGFCALSSPACGTCAEPPALGAACAAGRCGTGATCSNDVLENRKCVALSLEVGDACGATAYCRFGLSCVAGHCATGLTEGTKCSFDAPDQANCDPLAGLRCNGFTADAVCARASHAAVGEACGAGEIDTDAGLMLAHTECRADGRCPNEPGDTTCLARGALGEACDDSQPESCRTHLSCVEGRCALLDPSACR